LFKLACINLKKAPQVVFLQSEVEATKQPRREASGREEDPPTPDEE
jgi:hypothetical protein